jgi:hypothetical protein
MFGKQQGTGPPRGPGHYAEDGRWWWDQGRHRWFRVTGYTRPAIDWDTPPDADVTTQRSA